LKRRGFTLIELVVVIALIALLASMVVMAVSKMRVNGQRQQTRLIMQNLSAMLADYDVNRRVPFGAGNLSPTVIANAGLVNDIYLNCPGDVTATGVDHTGNAVQYTRYFMAQLMNVPSTATAIGKLPSSALMTFIGSNITNAPLYAVNQTYKVYDSVQDANGNVYIRTVLNTDPSGNTSGYVVVDGPTQAPPNYYYWMPALVIPASANAPLSTPVVLDAWGNPIIFVMGGVLGAPSSSSTGLLTAGGQSGQQVHSPDYHPFFASAGPDGNFSNGDDNLYSFEK
jgi:prepilin-type N-terminal cleavage/methylation domain-containing protein